MAITRLNNSSFTTGNKKFASFDTGYPSLMAAPTATDGGTGSTVSVAFTAQSGATSYTALSTPGSFTGTGTSSPITVSGLTSGTAYTFQIRANNSVGSGAYSAASNSVTPVTPPSYESIATLSGNGTSQALSFTNIPQTYTHLQIRAAFLASNGFSPDVRFNGDSGTNYSRLYIRAANTTASTAGQTGATQLSLFPNGTAGINPSTLIMDIYDYTNTNKYKTIKWTEGFLSAGGPMLVMSEGLWLAGSAITSISFGTSSYFAGNRIALYGIKGGA